VQAGASIADLPHALADHERLRERLAGRQPAVFLDYDGTLTPIVDRPEDAVISESMRDAVRGLAGRCTVCVVSGRDRPVVQSLMGVDDLVVAGSHGFDIWTPEGGAIEHQAAAGSEELLERVTARLRDEAWVAANPEGGRWHTKAHAKPIQPAVRSGHHSGQCIRPFHFPVT
jgi:trehalose 6-phosphate phosphatase